VSPGFEEFCEYYEKHQPGFWLFEGQNGANRLQYHHGLYTVFGNKLLNVKKLLGYTFEKMK